jgi:DNA-binding NarL/FixJ family response regulator
MSRLVTHYLAYIKQNKQEDDLPGRNFLSDLLFRFTGKEKNSEDREPALSTPVSEDPFLANMLTAREIEVIMLVAGGKTNGQIAEDLHLSINTVKRHLNNIFLKLGVATRTQAILVARKQGWLGS